MKITAKKAVLLFCICSVTLSTYAQTYKDNYNEREKDITELGLLRINPTLFTLFGIDANPGPSAQEIQGNAVFLKQVGDFNKAAVITKTENSAIKIVQNGNYNRTGLLYWTETAYADLQQNGDYNTIKDFVINPNLDVNLELIQNGDDLYFERFGANNLTKSMKFIQTDASPSIIVRSF